SSPSSHDDGPIEGGSVGVRVEYLVALRRLTTTAPLKARVLLGARAVELPLRRLTTTAPLKVGFVDRLGGGVGPSPSSHDDGPIEGTSAPWRPCCRASSPSSHDDGPIEGGFRGPSGRRSRALSVVSRRRPH